MTQKRKEQLKEYLPQFLMRIGVNPKKPILCLNPSHDDHNPNMHYNPKNFTVHCFRCDVTYDIFNLIGILYNIKDQKAIFEKVESIFDGKEKDVDLSKQVNIKIKSSIEERTHKSTHTKAPTDENLVGETMEYYKKCAKEIDKTNYMKNRGISDTTLKRFMIGFDPNFKGFGGKQYGAIIIPTSSTTYVARNTDPENNNKNNRIRKSTTGSSLFNYEPLLQDDFDEFIFVVEGEIDALSLEEVGANAIGLGGTGNIEQLVKLAKEKRPKKPLIIALDNDLAGRETTQQLVQMLKDAEIPFIIEQEDFSLYEEDCKDANDMLLKHKDRLEENIKYILTIAEGKAKEQEEAKQKIKEEYNKNSTYNYINDFLHGIKESVNTPYIPTVFPKLDKVLDGGLYEGLYIVGAISSLGKTTLVTQIADQVAEGGNDVLIFSLEMARTEIMAKSISRETIKESMIKYPKEISKYAKNTRGITTGSRYAYYSEEEHNIIEKSIEEYSHYAHRIYIHEGIGTIGVDQIRAEIEKHIKYTGNTPVVVIDYIQIIAPYDVRATDKQNIDMTVLELKRISRDYKIPLIGISSFNRSSYTDKVSMASFKESGAIEYGSDVLIGLQLQGATKDNVDELKKKNPREVELIILKNRNGATGEKIQFRYYPTYNYFEEV